MTFLEGCFQCSGNEDTFSVNFNQIQLQFNKYYRRLYQVWLPMKIAWRKKKEIL